MKLLKILRYAEWWEYKLPPLLGIGYATLLLLNKNIFEYSRYIFLVLISLIIGAIYVSVINDVTDIKDDLAAGKTNRMAGLPAFLRWLLPIGCIIIGVCFIIFFYYPHFLSCLFYTAPWVLFSLYSFKPFRLKNRGLFGVLADAGGSHIFTSLLIISSLTFFSGEKINVAWLVLVGIWALCYGMRGILWHQFTDRQNDIKSGIETFATKRNPHNFIIAEYIIIAIEIACLLCIIALLFNIYVIVAFLLYIILAILRHKKLYLQPVAITTSNTPFQILLLDFMQVFFPLSLLLYATVTQQNGWVVLVMHLILFPVKSVQVLKDVKKIITG